MTEDTRHIFENHCSVQQVNSTWRWGLVVTRAVFDDLHVLSQESSYTHTHAHTCWFLGFTGILHRGNGLLYKPYVLLSYNYPAPKLDPHLRLCMSTPPPPQKKTHSV